MSDSALKSPSDEIANSLGAAPEKQPAKDEPAPQAIPIDDSQVDSRYANFCRVTGTPEELIIDFALNPQPIGSFTDAIKIQQRIVTNFYTAKRLCHALQMAIHRHESAFGVLETNVQKRVSASRNS